MTKDKKVVILSAKRTPIGKFLGAFGSLSAPHLASFAIKSAIKENLTIWSGGQVLTKEISNFKIIQEQYMKVKYLTTKI